jgi:hypothetical protein
MAAPKKERVAFVRKLFREGNSYAMIYQLTREKYPELTKGAIYGIVRKGKDAGEFDEPRVVKNRAITLVPLPTKKS